MTTIDVPVQDLDIVPGHETGENLAGRRRVGTGEGSPLRITPKLVRTSTTSLTSPVNMPCIDKEKADTEYPWNLTRGSYSPHPLIHVLDFYYLLVFTFSSRFPD